MENLWQDLRFGIRTLLRNRPTSLLALLILTLGIGANTAIFSVISGVLLTPLPFPHPEGLVKLTDSAPRHGFARFSSSPPNFLDWRQQNRSFSTLDAWSSNRVNLTGGARPESVRAAAVTGTFFRMLDVQPLLLAAVGIYGLVSYSVAQRTHEIGIRVALGAASGTVMSMVLRQGMALVGLGLAAGLAASTAAVRLVADQLYEVSTLDPVVFVAVPLILAMVALVANWVPARRATRIDPLEALRAE